MTEDRKADLVERYGDWCQTYTGVKFYPLDPRPEDFNLEDIAHALSNLCRFNGHCKEFYSVAQHSVLVSRYAEIEVETTFESDLPYGSVKRELIFQRQRLDAARWGLSHDAAEAYLSDVPRPLKRDDAMAWFRDQEEKLLEMIGDVFCLGLYVSEVGHVDMRVLMTEMRDLMVDPPADWMVSGEPYESGIVCWDPLTAKRKFLHRFRDLDERHYVLLTSEQEATE